MNQNQSIKQNIKSIGINIAAVALAIAIGIPLGGSLLKQFELTTSTSPPIPTPISPDVANRLFQNVAQDVIVFGDTTCEFCKKGLSVLDNLGINYKIYYIDQDAEAKRIFKTLNAEGVPVLISRSQIFIGFKQDVWEKFVQKEPR
ncbi:glutaredoxin family protein [Undibacterium amnicola]|uniref:Glutaredoxin family protein n=1 Tax=Undibacterium amnicola TaxID=1834038 RepID=A0ABR6XUL3_9BURK|nr:glutaredoxin family protein [Undibacterium amnicola]MBC3833149.1 glutaredoxin family protein [Undibacterium amnicola]